MTNKNIQLVCLEKPNVIKFFNIHSRKEKYFLGLVGTDGKNLAYKVESSKLLDILEHYISKVKDGSYTVVDETDYFMLKSIKWCFDALKYKKEYQTSEILSSEGNLEALMEEMYERQI